MATGKSQPQDFATKMKRLRKKGNISIEALAKKTGLDADFIQKIENNEATPPVSVIIQLSTALTVDSGAFLSADDATTRKRKAEGFIKRKNAYYYKTLTPGAEHRHMKGFHVTIPPEKTHEGVEYKHDGEEFVYVLEGRLEILADGKMHVLKKGQSIHFDSGKTHKLSNPGKKATELIVMVYTP